MSKLPTLPTTETIGPRPALPSDRMPTAHERRQAEGPLPRPQRKAAKPLPAGEQPRFVNSPGHMLQPAEGTVEPPEQLTAADSAPGMRLDRRVPSMKPSMYMGQRSPIIRANRKPKDETAPKRMASATVSRGAKPLRMGTTLRDRMLAEGVRQQLREKRKEKSAAADPGKAVS